MKVSLPSYDKWAPFNFNTHGLPDTLCDGVLKAVLLVGGYRLQTLETCFPVSAGSCTCWAIVWFPGYRGRDSPHCFPLHIPGFSSDIWEYGLQGGENADSAYSSVWNTRECYAWTLCSGQLISSMIYRVSNLLHRTVAGEAAPPWAPENIFVSALTMWTSSPTRPHTICLSCDFYCAHLLARATSSKRLGWRWCLDNHWNILICRF